MPREPKADKTKRAKKVFAILRKTYPDAKCSLTHRNPLQLLIATILAAQCTDKRVNIVTKDLFKRYRTAKDFAGADPAELQEEIRSTGFYRNKTKNILGAARMMVEKHGGKVPDTMDELLALPGVARKTANVVLGNAFGKNVGFVVDTHVKRLSGRLGFTTHTDPVKIERDMMALLPQNGWALDSHLLVFHGRACCDARKPDCPACPVAKLCPRKGL